MIRPPESPIARQSAESLIVTLETPSSMATPALRSFLRFYLRYASSIESELNTDDTPNMRRDAINEVLETVRSVRRSADTVTLSFECAADTQICEWICELGLLRYYVEGSESTTNTYKQTLRLPEVMDEYKFPIDRHPARDFDEAELSPTTPERISRWIMTFCDAR